MRGLTLTLTSLAVFTVTTPVKADPGPWIDTNDRAIVARSASAILHPAETVPMQWSGDMHAGVAGDISSSYRETVRARINWMRQMAGVPGHITFDSAYNQKAEAAALLISANGQVSHTPPSSWKFYSTDAAIAAEHSNLCLGFQPWDAGCVFNYMEDRGLGNESVAHRRWLLFPATEKMGTGEVEAGDGWRSASALWVIDQAGKETLAPTSRRAPTRSAFVAWPSEGYFPYQFLPARWSLSYPDADFSAAGVSMTRDGVQVHVKLEPVIDGYGDNTLVWIPDDLDANAPASPVALTGQSEVTVAVSNVTVHGKTLVLRYRITVFDPLSN
jgi:hypothetical protein